MKKILLTILGLALASTAWSAQTAVTQISGTQASVGALKTQVNTKLETVELNRQDHETRVAAMESGKAGVDCFSSESAFNACFALDWSAGSVSSWADVQALITGSGDYIKYDGTRGNPVGSVDLSAYLSKTNTTEFTPSGDYHPATKKYVDDSITAGGGYTDEQAQDAAGAMFSGNTETGITVTYNDSTGKVDFVVATQSDVNFTSTLNTKLAGIATGAEVNVNADWNSSNGDSQILNKPTIPTISDAVYGPGWNGDTGAASKNAIYDKIETIAGGTLPTCTNDEDVAEWDTTTSAWVCRTYDRLSSGTGITITEDGGGAGVDTVNVTANTYQAYDADWLGVTANGASLISAANYAAMKTLLDTDDIQTLTGIAAGTADLGTFTGTTIADSSTIKTGMQALETAVEGKQATDADLTDLADGLLTASKVAGSAATTASKATTYTIGTDSANELYGGTVYVASATTITAPAVVAGMNFSVVTIGDIAVSLDVNAADKMVLDGVTLADGDKATNSSKAGDTITCQYYSADGWYCWSGTVLGGHWTDGN